jgi:hypothetical protein
MTYKQGSGSSTVGNYGKLGGRNNYGSSSNSSSNYASSSYSASSYNLGAMKAGYRLAPPPAAKPYDLERALGNINYESEINIGKERYTLTKPELYFKRSELKYERPELSLRSICPLCKQPVSKAA